MGVGGVSPHTFTANWLHVEERGRGGQSRYVHREGLQSRGEGGGGIRADTRLRLNY